MLPFVHLLFTKNPTKNQLKLRLFFSNGPSGPSAKVETLHKNHWQLLPKKLGGGFKCSLFSPRKLGKFPILTNIFQMG